MSLNSFDTPYYYAHRLEYILKGMRLLKTADDLVLNDLYQQFSQELEAAFADIETDRFGYKRLKVKFEIDLDYVYELIWYYNGLFIVNHHADKYTFILSSFEYEEPEWTAAELKAPKKARMTVQQAMELHSWKELRKLSPLWVTQMKMYLGLKIGPKNYRLERYIKQIADVKALPAEAAKYIDVNDVIYKQFVAAENFTRMFYLDWEVMKKTGQESFVFLTEAQMEALTTYIYDVQSDLPNKRFNYSVMRNLILKYQFEKNAAITIGSDIPYVEAPWYKRTAMDGTKHWDLNDKENWPAYAERIKRGLLRLNNAYGNYIGFRMGAFPKPKTKYASPGIAFMAQMQAEFDAVDAEE